MYLNELKWGLISFIALSIVIVPVGVIANSVSYRSGQWVILSSIAFSIFVGYVLVYELKVW
ncbi:hypothetical protein AUR66_16770 [Haloferax profundi]|uniref:Uncharacterized protein n=1 Tax=Haloferax profundi TaxID=1544718 RepID=A0A0W1SAA8_9EURY|nr:hypothetical protein AUR66_16770 [Haloferax profundi]